MARQYVFPYDAEDIKAHKFFKGLPWERLHTMTPPFTPKLQADDDTRYFDEEDGMSDTWESMQTASLQTNLDGCGNDGQMTPDYPERTTVHNENRLVVDNLRDPIADSINDALDALDASVQVRALEWIATPYDASRLKLIDAEIDQLLATGLPAPEAEALRCFVRRYGKREKKRPRDRLLRDKHTKKLSMELRMRHTFMGYTWRRSTHLPVQTKCDRNVESSIALMRSSHRGHF